jgi:catechol 2,3-dioxygenase-like lactoylglutathione lyase family enzyme
MPVQFNHTIVHARDPEASASFLSEILGLPAPKAFGPFQVVQLDNGVSLDFIGAGAEDEWQPQHYAFLVSEEEFDQILARIEARGLTYFADPGGEKRDQINHHDGGRGLYWADPSGNWLEIITRPYGSG